MSLAEWQYKPMRPPTWTTVTTMTNVTYPAGSGRADVKPGPEAATWDKWSAELDGIAERMAAREAARLASPLDWLLEQAGNALCIGLRLVKAHWTADAAVTLAAGVLWAVLAWLK